MGRHEYKFVIDGKVWKTDPGNRDRTNVYRNSVVVVGPLHPPDRHADERRQVPRRVSLSPGRCLQNRLACRLIQSLEADRTRCRAQTATAGTRRRLELPEGRHEYKFVVDGKMERDPGNPVVWGKKQGSVVWARP